MKVAELVGRDPISALSDQDGVLAIITGVDGPSYRPLGAMMAILPDGSRIGTLSSGCIEADLTLHAQKALENGQVQNVLYGRGSPFVDIQLPCGGGLEIHLFPNPDRAVLAQLIDLRADRHDHVLTCDPITGAMEVLLGETAETGWQNGRLAVAFQPDLQFMIFGKGPEAQTFAALIQSIGFSGILLSPDPETQAIGAAAGCEVIDLPRPGFPVLDQVDHRTGIVLFFHDHDWEPDILASALKTNAFYIGSQGRQRARDTRFDALRLLGVSDADLARLHGPIGLIPSARDASTLAVSVLAEILAKRGTGRVG
jgi:xanthine dehydrogenase accessory factor